MRSFTRRGLLKTAALAVPAAQLAGVRALAAAAKPVTIRDVEVFKIDIPVSAAEDAAGLDHKFVVARVVTDAGVNGYSFAGPTQVDVADVRKVLVGQDLFAVERHLSRGLLAWGGVEHAVWDAIGKIAGRPVYQLLGGGSDRVKAYLTCVWKGKLDQSHVPYSDQAQMAVKIRDAGFEGMKIRAWRPNPMDDVAACKVITSAAGPNLKLMFDRTAHRPEEVGQRVWDYKTGLQVARGMQEAGAYWLEEPFSRDDYSGPARLSAAVDLLITGGEGYRGLGPFRECLRQQTYDILQPEGAGAGGILTCVQVAALAKTFGLPCILHGSMSLRVAGWIQASLAFGAPWQELALISPPLLPDEQWSPGLKVLKGHQEVYKVRDGHVVASDRPGLGFEVDESAVERFRVR